MRTIYAIYISISILLLCGAIDRSFGQDKSVNLQLNTRVLEQRYCSDPNTEDQFDVKMQLELQYKNIGKQPIIFDKNSDVIVGFRTAAAIKDLEVAPYNDLSSTKQSDGISESGDKPGSRFVTLRPNQSYLVETWLRLPYSSEWALRENQILQIAASTWPGTKKQSDDLREKWKSIGLLWSDNVRSQPMPFAIEQDPQLEECSN